MEHAHPRKQDWNDRSREGAGPVLRAPHCKKCVTVGAFVCTHGSLLDRVGSVTTASEAIVKLNAFVVEITPKHDLSTESWRAFWDANVPKRADGSSGEANRAIVSDLFNRLDACAPGYAGGCDRATDDFFKGLNKDQGLAADNGLITFQQFMGFLGRYPTNPEDKAPPSPPSDPNVVDDMDRRYAALTDSQITDACTAMPSAAAACKLGLEKLRSDAKAKIARLDVRGEFTVSRVIAPPKTSPIPPQPTDQTDPMRAEKIAAGAGIVPIALGAVAAIHYGLRAFAVGGVIGVVAAGATYFWAKKRIEGGG